MSERMRWHGGLLALCLILLAPLLLVDVPPLLDYPNHLARLQVLAMGADDPVLSQFYAPRWGIIPDMGIDVLGLALVPLLPVHIAGRVILGIVLLLPVLGTAAYSRALHGRTPWALGGGLLAYSGTFLLGFLNFTAAIGLALLFAAAWLRWREDHPAPVVLLAIPAAVALFFCHLMGLLFFGLLIGAHEAAALWPARADHRVLLLSAVRRLGAGAAVFAVPVTLYAMSDLGAMRGEAVFLPPAAKAAQLMMPLTNYSLPLDGATVVLIALILVASRWRVPLSAGIAIAVLALLYAAAPFAFKGTFSLDTRLVVMLGFLLFAGIAPISSPPVSASARCFGVLLVLVFAVRMTVLGMIWYGHNQDIASLRATIAPVPPGATVFVSTSRPSGNAARLSDGARTDIHLPALLLIERRAWWPFLFDNVSQQPIETRAPYAGLAERVGAMVDLNAVTPRDLCGFDFLLTLSDGGATLSKLAPDPVCAPPVEPQPERTGHDLVDRRP
jgi:hypothetical protein